MLWHLQDFWQVNQQWDIKSLSSCQSNLYLTSFMLWHRPFQTIRIIANDLVWVKFGQNNIFRVWHFSNCSTSQVKLYDGLMF